MPQLQASPTYRFRLEFALGRRRRIHELALDAPDFAGAVEAAFFDGLRRGVFRDYDPPFAQARLEPRFAKADGSPYTLGFTVVLPAPEGGERRTSFDMGFLEDRAKRICTDLLVQRRIPIEGLLLYQLAAYLDEAEPAPLSGLRLEIEAPSVSVPIRAGSLAALGVAEAWDAPRAADHRVLIPRRVIEDAVDEARRAPEREVGGVLLGHLRRDNGSGEIFLQVTCMVPAEETEATEASVTFTAATWAQVREVVAMRGEGEIFAGWVHSHPFRLCADCPLTPPPECVNKVLFYSADDEFLMGLSFPRPFMVGLLTAAETKLERSLGHLPVRLFGWHNGKIRARGFEVID